jgi:phosphoribosylformimino-5-aminoimidazole carboxamide ribotide isomerase
VIDLLDGVVVHAKKGQRQHYQPIQSQLTASCQPFDIVAALLDVYPFTQLYIADLNAIQKINGVYTSHYDLIAQIQQQFPQLTLWVDAGIRDSAALKHWEKLHARLIIGSENFNALDSFLAMQFSDTNWILSLDFKPDGYCGPIELLTQTQYWPKEVIVMSLAHVGANQGPDMELLTKLLAHAHRHHLIAAGGIRDIDDLTQLDALHIHGALIASALHQQQITAVQLASMLK